MRITRFEVRDQRSIRYAACEEVPPLMIVAGPNGAGKSTLLNEIRYSSSSDVNLRMFAPTPGIVYVGPHRSMKRAPVQYKNLVSSSIRYEDALTQPQTQYIEGLTNVQTSVRDPWGLDEYANLLKPALCQIEIERQQAVIARLDRDREIPLDSVPSCWKPLQDLVQNLLPHLHFLRIDLSDFTNARCLFTAHDTERLVEFDDLSSGEKSVIQMFYPLLEHRIRALLSEIDLHPVR